MEIHFAPMQGYADPLYQRLHAEIYGGIDRYYTPFIRVEKGEPRRQDMNRLTALAGYGIPVTPQVIFGSVGEFDLLAEAVKDAGFSEIDLNLGCPFPLQLRKKRGAAMIGDTGTMQEVAARMADDSGTAYSVKMRLGNRDADEWKALMPILNEVKLSHIALHPRIASQGYEGELLKDSFREFCELSTNPVIWNGGISTLADIERVSSEFPETGAVMIGRGLLGRPSLAAEFKSGEEWSPERRSETLMEFHSRLLEGYEATLCGPTQILQKIKPFWDYLEPEIGRKKLKLIRKATTLEKYRLVTRD